MESWPLSIQIHPELASAKNVVQTMNTSTIRHVVLGSVKCVTNKDPTRTTMISWMEHQRLEDLERRVEILEGKPDPGVPCRESGCINGKIRDDDNKLTTCQRCKGTGRQYS